MNIKKYLKKPQLLLYYLGMNGWFHWMPDEAYLKMIYWAHFGRTPNLDDPKTYTEKLQWLKLNDRKPEYISMVDKYEAKKYVADKIGSEYIIPTLGIWDRFEDIDFETLPEQFVLKCTHDSGGLVIVKDKSNLDLRAAEKKIRKSLNRNYFYAGREWPYKHVKSQILAEQYMEDGALGELSDYKVMCFGGEPKLIQIHRGRFDIHTQDIYDVDWNKLMIYQSLPMSDEVLKKPIFLEEMLELSRKLSQKVPQLRVDWYYVDQRLYFGELTFFDASGFDNFVPDVWNDVLGSWVALPSPNKETV